MHSHSTYFTHKSPATTSILLLCLLAAFVVQGQPPSACNRIQPFNATSSAPPLPPTANLNIDKLWDDVLIGGSRLEWQAPVDVTFELNIGSGDVDVVEVCRVSYVTTHSGINYAASDVEIQTSLDGEFFVSRGVFQGSTAPGPFTEESFNSFDLPSRPLARFVRLRLLSSLSSSGIVDLREVYVYGSAGLSPRAVTDGCKQQNTEVFDACLDGDVGGCPAATRCCSIDGTQCSSFCPSSAPRLTDFRSAQATCAANGMRLCSRAEIDGRVCCNTGCQFDGERVWIDEVCSTADGGGDEGSIDVFVLMGQSNMAGRGALEPPEVVEDRIIKFNEAGVWEPAKDPLHEDNLAKVGPGLTFATSLRDSQCYNLRSHIGLVPTAVGGTNLTSQWQRGGQQYDNMIAKVTEALQTPGARLAGFLWQQGERDSAVAAAANAYGANLVAMIIAVRQDLSASGVPFIAGTLPDFMVEGGIRDQALVDAVNDGIENAASSGGVIPYGVVGAVGLTDVGDNLHFDRASAKTLGERHAQAFLDIVTK